MIVFYGVLVPWSSKSAHNIVLSLEFHIAFCIYEELEINRWFIYYQFKTEVRTKWLQLQFSLPTSFPEPKMRKGKHKGKGKQKGGRRKRRWGKHFCDQFCIKIDEWNFRWHLVIILALRYLYLVLLESWKQYFGLQLFCWNETLYLYLIRFWH